MNPIRIFRTATFRLTALYTLLFSTSFLIVFGIIYWITVDALRQQMILSIGAELSALEQEYSKGREAELTWEIKKRTGSGKYAFNYYLLQDKSGRKLAGNLPGMSPFKGWREIPAPYPLAAGSGNNSSEMNAHTALVKSSTLQDGTFIIVGNSTYQSNEAKEAIREAFFWGMGAILLLAFGGGMILSANFLRQVDEISQTAHAIVEGRLTERIRTRGTNDELDRLAINLNDMLNRIQILMESLQQVSNNIAHDLRTPLGRLRQHLEAARRDAKSVDAYEKATDQALVEADGILATFGSLLRIAQIEAITRRSSFRPVDLSAVFESVADAYGPVGEDSDKKIEADIASGITINGDRELLVQMFVNIVENALNHTPSGTTIRITLRQGPKGPIGILSDNGGGIPESDREKIFRRFYRLEASRSTPGSGLGLALVKAIADLHGITVTITDNHPGAVFTIYFDDRSK